MIALPEEPAVDTDSRNEDLTMGIRRGIIGGVIQRREKGLDAGRDTLAFCWHVLELQGASVSPGRVDVIRVHPWLTLLYPGYLIRY